MPHAIKPRRVLESNPLTNTYLLVERDQIHFNPESNYWLDAEEFERRVRLAESKKPAELSESERLAIEEVAHRESLASNVFSCEWNRAWGIKQQQLTAIPLRVL
jgi:hypothetical protein